MIKLELHNDKSITEVEYKSCKKCHRVKPINEECPVCMKTSFQKMWEEENHYFEFINIPGYKESFYDRWPKKKSKIGWLFYLGGMLWLQLLRRLFLTNFSSAGLTHNLLLMDED